MEARDVEESAGENLRGEAGQAWVTWGMRRRVLLSGLGYFACILILTAWASPVFMRLIDRHGEIRLTPSASFLTPLAMDACISRDGTWIAVATTKGIEIRTLPGGDLERRLGDGPVDRIFGSPDGRMIASVSAETLEIWDLERPDEEPTLTLPCTVPLVAWFPDSRRLTAFRDDDIVIWDAGSGQVLRRLAAPEGATPCRALAVSPHPRSPMIATAWVMGAEGFTVVWNSTTYEEVMEKAVNISSDPPGAQVDPSRAIVEMAWTPNGSHLSYLVANWPGTNKEWHRLELLDTRPWAQGDATVLPMPGAPHVWLHSYAWSPGSDRIAYVRNMSHTLGIYNLGNGSVVEAELGEEDSWGTYNRVLGFSQDEKSLLVILLAQRSVEVRDPGKGLLLGLRLDYTGGISGAVLHPGGDLVATHNYGTGVTLVDPASGRTRFLFEALYNFFCEVRCSTDGESIHFLSDTEMCTWSVESGEFTAKWNVSPVWFGTHQIRGEYGCKASDLSPDESTVALIYGWQDSINEVQLRSMKDGSLLRSRELPPPRNLRLLFGGSILRWSPDGKALAFTDYHDIYLWDISSDEITMIGTHANWTGMRWHPTLPLLLSTGANSTILWDVDTAESVVVLDRAMRGPHFSPDGSMVCDGGGIYDSGGLDTLYRLGCERSYAIGWSLDGKRIATVTPPFGPVELYDLPEG